MNYKLTKNNTGMGAVLWIFGADCVLLAILALSFYLTWGK